MALTSSGLVTQRYSEIVADLQTKLRNNISSTLDVSSTSYIGQVNSIFAAALADLNDLAASVHSAFNRDEAEGKNLDDLVHLIGISRISSSPSNGYIWLTGTAGTTVPRNTQFAHSTTGDLYNLVEAKLLSPSSCYSVEYIVAQVKNSTTYTINVEGTSYSYTTSASATVSEIITGLYDVFAAATLDGFTVENDSNTALIITSTASTSELAITATTYLSVDNVTCVGSIEADEDGALEAALGSITIISTPVSGLTSATNPADLTEGRATETDEELRLRAAQSVQIAGKATVPAITSAIANVSGVSLVSVIENTTMYSDADGRPAKSYECVVVGGADADIGETVWDTKPAGIQTYGNTVVVVTDDNDNEHGVYFSRPVDQYIHVTIEYSLYDEEAFPSGGEDTMKSLITTAGNSLSVGEDVIAKRLLGPLYSGISGVGNTTITVGVTEAADELPSIYEDVVEIGAVQIANFSTDRVYLTLV